MPEFRLKTKTNQTETETVPKPSLPNHEKGLMGKRETGRSQTQQATANLKDSGKGTAERALITGHSSYALSILLTKQTNLHTKR